MGCHQSVPPQQWLSLRHRPESPHEGLSRELSNILMLNDWEFIICIGDRQIFKYNVLSDEWTLFWSFTFPLIRIQIMTLNQSTMCLHLIANNGAHRILDITKMTERNGRSVQRRAMMLLDINGILCRWDSNQNGHSEYEQNTNLWTLKSPQGIHGQITLPRCRVVKGTYVFVATQNMVLVIGGVADHHLYHRRICGIWRYCIVSRQWAHIINTRFDLTDCGAVLSADEHFVVISSFNGIHILEIVGGLQRGDVASYKLWRTCSSVQPEFVPAKRLQFLLDSHRMTRSCGQGYGRLLVEGWIRQSVSIIIPSDIVMMICEMGSTVEMIHWMGNYRHVDSRTLVRNKYSRRHLASSLQRLLESRVP